jgi:peptidoglycan/LPS O-acetylase OafA/YrhL
LLVTDARAGLWTVTLQALASPGMVRLSLAAAVVASHLSRWDIGRVAVALFFLLSGYWTVRIWREKFQAQTWRYILSRYWRIVPLFLLVTLAAAWAPANLTLLGLASQANDPTGVAWSLDVELQFYLLVPLVAGILAARPGAVLLLSLPILAAGVWLEAQFGVVTVAKYLPAFVAGAVIHLKDWRPGPAAAALSLAAFAAMGAVTAATPFLDKAQADPFDRDLWAMLWALPAVPFMAWSLTIRSTPLDRHLGNLSFPLYLVHFPAIALAATYLGAGPAGKLAGLSLAIVAAAAAYFLFDRPVDRLRVLATERGPWPPHPRRHPPA